MADEDPKIKFQYIKSSLFRIAHIDGAYGGVTPRLDIFISLYSERPPIPQVVVHHITKDGKVGDEIKEQRVSKEGIVREAEIGVLLDGDVAKNLVKWLQEKIDQIELIRTQIEKSKTEVGTKPTALPEPESIH